MTSVQGAVFIKTSPVCSNRRRKSLNILAIVLALSLAPKWVWAKDTKVRFTATIDRIIGIEAVNFSDANNTLQGEITFSFSNYLEPGFYDGHTWQNAVKQITFGPPINATFSGMGVAMYPNQKFISVFYDADKCPHTGIVCAANGTSKFTLSDGSEIDLKALNYHIHQPYSEVTNPQLANVIERFVTHAGDGTTIALVRYHYRGKTSREPALTVLMTINTIEH